jgi:hypothetical protein
MCISKMEIAEQVLATVFYNISENDVNRVGVAKHAK